jgi:hypothetical protein
LGSVGGTCGSKAIMATIAATVGRWMCGHVERGFARRRAGRVLVSSKRRERRRALKASGRGHHGRGKSSRAAQARSCQVPGALGWLGSSLWCNPKCRRPWRLMLKGGAGSHEQGEQWSGEATRQWPQAQPQSLNARHHET